MPMNRVPRMTAIQVRVALALRVSGFLKAGTPLEMASTPRHRRTACRERLQYEEKRQWLDRRDRGKMADDRVMLDQERLDQPDGDEEQRAADKDVGGNGKNRT